MVERNIEQGFLSVAHAAAWADVSVRTIKRWIARGLPVRQAAPGEKVLVKPSDIDTFLKRRQAQRADLDALVDEMMICFGASKNQ